MIQVQLKLRPCKSQASEMERWLFHLQAVYNWGLRKIELNANNHIYFSRMTFQNLLGGHSDKLQVPAKAIQGTLCTAYDSWTRCFRHMAGRPHLKGRRNPLRSMFFPEVVRRPSGNRISLPWLGTVRFHKMEIPEGKIKCARVMRRPSGWYACLFIDAHPQPIPRVASNQVGIDPGFTSLLTLSTGEAIAHPRELEAAARMLAQAQRGHRARIVAKIHERLQNRRRDRNHKLSFRLVAENALIAFSADSHKGVARRFGKSVSSSSHGELRRMLAYKSASSGTRYIEVNPKYSTMTCSACGCLSGPTGLNRLAVRQWVCNECGTQHERDVNAARNALIVAVGMTVGVQEPGIPEFISPARTTDPHTQTGVRPPVKEAKNGN